MAANPQLKWHNARRGYLSCHVTPDAWQTDYRTVPYITRPDAPLETPARFRLEHGRATLTPV